MKKIIVGLLLAVLFFASFNDVYAQNNSEATATASPSATSINSFELFWPIVPGKTKGESLYFLKRVKENLRGILIFGDPQKADYLMFLGTKRSVEAEKLINDGKKEFAEETIAEAIANLQSAKSKVEKALQKGSPFSQQAANIFKQAKNIETFSYSMKASKVDYSKNFEDLAKTSREIADLLD